MKIRIIRGQNQIGGSIIELSTEQARLIFDIGIKLDEEKPKIPEIDGLFQGKPQYDAVFISHYHADHIGLERHLLPEIPLYMGEKCFKINRFVNEYTGKPCDYSPRFFRSSESVAVKDITITPYLCDHSAFDAYMFVIENSGKKVLYTGDFRANGRKSYDKLLNALPTVDSVIIEGTTLSREDFTNITEENLQKIAENAIGDRKRVFFMQAATNIDRIVTAYKAARAHKLLFLQDVYMAGITSAIGGSIPNPMTFSDVKAFMTHGGDEQFQRLKAFRNRIGKEDIVRSDFAMCVRPSMRNYLENLSELTSFEGGILFYSMWSGYREKPDIRNFLEFMESKGVKIHNLHTSGHADAATIERE